MKKRKDLHKSKQTISSKKCLFISSFTGEGTENLINKLGKHLNYEEDQ